VPSADLEAAVQVEGDYLTFEMDKLTSNDKSDYYNQTEDDILPGGVSIGESCYSEYVFGEIEGFELAGSDGVFRPAKAVRRRPDPTVLYVSNYDVGSPVYLRYNFKNCSVGRLWDAFGQPVVPFRTDNF